MLNCLANNIAQFFYDNKIIRDRDSIEIYAYGLELMISALVNVVTILIISVFFNNFFEAMAFLAAFISIRTFAGGYHASSHLNCFLILLFVYALNLTFVHFIPINMVPYLVLTFTSISLALIIILAPIQDANKPLDIKEKQKCRRISLHIITVEFLIIVLFIIKNKYSSVLLNFSNGQLAASLSLIAAKIINLRKGVENEKGNVWLDQV